MRRGDDDVPAYERWDGCAWSHASWVGVVSERVSGRGAWNKVGFTALRNDEFLYLSGAAATEFLGFEDDEVFVEGLQGGVGEAGCAV